MSRTKFRGIFLVILGVISIVVGIVRGDMFSSATMCIGYLLPIVRDAYFPGARFRKPERMPAGGCLTGPVLGYALLLIVLGLVPGLCGTVAGLLGAGLF